MKHFITILFIGLPIFLLAQKPCSNPKSERVLTNSFQCNWEFIELKDTSDATVILHSPTHVPCVFKATASVTIVKIKNDTIRILDVCNLQDYKTGEQIKVVSVSKPYYKVIIPTFFEEEDPTFKTYIYRCNEYDEKILKTTWGHIVGSDEKDAPVENR
ncbi:MAG: hypothetical protein ACPG19_13675 [Saprospiraceae bacterium]